MARHGTDLGGLPNFGNTPAEEFDNGSMLEALKADHIIVMPQQVGLGVSKLKNQLWQQLAPVQKDGDACLAAVYAKAKVDYALVEGERLNFFVIGHSLPGTRSRGC
jgi:hypothetical protein